MAKLLPVHLIDPSPFAHLSPPDPENQARIREDLEAHRGEILNPLHVIRKDGERWELLGGHDRLEAARAAGLTEVPVRDFTGLVGTDEEKVSHLLRDNNNRKSAEKRAGVRWYLERHTDWSDRRIADEVGCSHPFVGQVRASLEAEGVVETVTTVEGRDGVSQPATKPPRESRPVTKARPLPAVPVETWREEPKARAEKALGSVPEEERQPLRSIVEEPGIPDSLGAEMLERVAAMPPEERSQVVELAKSDDRRDRSLAKTKAADRPPMPDDRFLILARVASDLANCIEFCDRDADPSFRERVEAVRSEVLALKSMVSRRSA